MLGKLIKYEWKNVAKVGGVLLLAILAVTVLGCIMLQMPWMREVYEGGEGLSEAQSVGLVFMLMISFVLYIFMLVGIFYGILIFLGVNFYKSMYSEQGYLTQTLPVTPNQLLVSKIFVSGIWYVLIEIGVVLSVVALVCSAMAGALAPEGYTLWEAIGEVVDELKYVMDSEAASFFVHYMIFMALTIIISPFCTMIMLFGALTIGQLSKKYKAVMGVLSYFGIGIVNMVIAMIVQMIYTLKLTVDTIQNPSAVTEMTDMVGMYYVNLIVIAVMAAVLYWVSHYILKKKLNME